MLIDLDLVDKDYAAHNRSYDVRIIADHYGIYKDLFGDAFFIPRVHMNIEVRYMNRRYWFL